MITLNSIDGLNLSRLDIDLNVQPVKYSNERNKIIVGIAMVIAFPIAFGITVSKNFKGYKKIRKADKQLRDYMAQFETAFNLANEEQRIEMYSSLNQLVCTLNEIPVNGVEKTKGGFFTKGIIKTYVRLMEYVNNVDQKYYKLTYPTNGDPNDPEFIKQILEAHSKSNVQHC